MEKMFSVRSAQQEDGAVQLLGRILGTTVRGTLLASATRTISTTTSEINTEGAKALYLFVNCTAASGTGGLTIYVQTQDPATGIWVLTLVATATITTIRTTVLVFGNGVASGSGITLPTGQGDRGVNLPKTVRVHIVHSDATNYTYSVGYEVVP